MQIDAVAVVISCVVLLACRRCFCAPPCSIPWFCTRGYYCPSIYGTYALCSMPFWWVLGYSCCSAVLFRAGRSFEVCDDKLPMMLHGLLYCPKPISGCCKPFRGPVTRGQHRGTHSVSQLLRAPRVAEAWPEMRFCLLVVFCRSRVNFCAMRVFSALRFRGSALCSAALDAYAGWPHLICLVTELCFWTHRRENMRLFCVCWTMYMKRMMHIPVCIRVASVRARYDTCTCTHHALYLFEKKKTLRSPSVFGSCPDPAARKLPIFSSLTTRNCLIPCIQPRSMVRLCN